MTGQQFRDYVVRTFKRTDKDTELYEFTTDVIADMRRRFNSEDFSVISSPITISTLGDFKTDLPSNFGHIIGDVSIIDTADDEDYLPLKKISKELYDQKYPERLSSAIGNRDTGEPRYFCIYGNDIYFGPVPDKTTYQYQINYTTEAFTEVTSGTADVPFTDKYRIILRNGVLEQLYRSVERFDLADQWKIQYELTLRNLIDNDEDNVQSDEMTAYHGV